ncbi:MAG: flagellar export chaperone FliS [Gammaproteobacteria bacterium]|nr:flagellar export chaperone FliS [Gammaproteobacteria bacterium]
MKNEATRHYKNQELMSASPARLVVMLYDRAIYSLNDAVKAIEVGDIERRWKSNKNANEVITHLALTLDFEKGGQIARNLNDLYKFMLLTLVNVDVRNDAQPARDVINLLEPLRESWDQIAKGSNNTAAPSAVAAIDNHSDEMPPAGIAISA